MSVFARRVRGGGVCEDCDDDGGVVVDVDGRWGRCARGRGEHSQAVADRGDAAAAERSAASVSRTSCDADDGGDGGGGDCAT